MPEAPPASGGGRPPPFAAANAFDRRKAAGASASTHGWPPADCSLAIDLLRSAVGGSLPSEHLPERAHRPPAAQAPWPPILDGHMVVLAPESRLSRDHVEGVVKIVARHPAFACGLDHIPPDRIKQFADRGSVRGLRYRVSSVKTDRRVRAASHLEFCLALLCETDPDVLTYVEQPLTIAYMDGGKRRRYRPDMFVRRTDRDEVLEVKRAREANTAEAERGYRLRANALAALGLSFRLVTEQQLKREPRWSNLQLLVRDRHAPMPTAAMLDDLQALFRARGPLRIDAPEITAIGVRPEQLRMLLWRCFLRVNVEAPLGPDTLVHLNPALAPPASG